MSVVKILRIRPAASQNCRRADSTAGLEIRSIDFTVSGKAALTPAKNSIWRVCEVKQKEDALSINN
jgi:hypothetical protein